jgi:hypothetical protein
VTLTASGPSEERIEESFFLLEHFFVDIQMDSNGAIFPFEITGIVIKIMKPMMSAN